MSSITSQTPATQIRPYLSARQMTALREAQAFYGLALDTVPSLSLLIRRAVDLLAERAVQAYTDPSSPVAASEREALARAKAGGAIYGGTHKPGPTAEGQP